MQWTDEGIVIGVKRHGEASAILELMTREHGRHLGLVRGGFGTRMKPILQTGNSVSASWRARLDEHLGNYTIEPSRQRASNFFAAPHAIYGVTHLAALMRLLPERDPHAGLYSVFEEVLDRLEDPVLAAPLVVRFELQLLTELGFGLDLDAMRRDRHERRSHLCLAEVGAGGLARGRRAVGRQDAAAAGLPARPRPAAGRPRSGRRLCADRACFLERHVLEPRGLQLSDERAHFIAALLRGPRSAVAV